MIVPNKIQDARLRKLIGRPRYFLYKKYYKLFCTLVEDEAELNRTLLNPSSDYFFAPSAYALHKIALFISSTDFSKNVRVISVSRADIYSLINDDTPPREQPTVTRGRPRKPSVKARVGPQRSPFAPSARTPRRAPIPA